MKKDLNISRIAIVCVLCTAAVSGAYAASSVRSLGGSGTYTSASSAASAGSSGATTAVRGGSLRVTPSSGQSGSSTTISAGTTTSGRVATSPRLSIGQYLGGATSVSGGGSSLRPGTGSGSSGGGSSSGGDVSGGDLTGLRDQIDQLGRDVEDLRTADDNINDALLDKQDTLNPVEGGFIIIDDNTNEIFVDVDALEQELEMVAGREVELGSNDTHLLWRYVGDPDWEELIAIADITGPQGEKGEPGEAANLDAYSTTEQMNQAIGNAIAALADVYATTEYVDEKLSAKADKATTLAGYGIRDAMTQEEIAEAITDATTGIATSDEIEQFKTDVAGLKTTVGDENSGLVKDVNDLSGTVTALDGELETVSQLAGSAASTATGAAESAAQALDGLTGKEDKSNKKTTLTDSDTDYPSTSAVTAALADKADKSELANYATNESVDTKLENYYTISEVDDKVADVVAGDMGAALTGKEDKSNKTQTIDASSTADQYPSAAAVYGALEQKADTTTVEQIEQDVTNIQNDYNTINETVTNLGDTINNADTGLKKQVEDALNSANAAQEAVAGKQDALGFTPENVANKSQTVVDDETKYPSSAAVYGELETKANVSDLTNYATTTALTSGLDGKEDKANKATAINAENQSSSDVYPTVGAITQWTNTKINELSETGLPVNPDNIGAGAITTDKIANDAVTSDKIADGAVGTNDIANGAVTEEKLSEELNAEIDGKEDKANLKALAYKEQITNDDVADDAAIAKSKLALDVQTALDNAANAVAAPAGEKAINSVLGTDGEGNPVWYEIVFDLSE